MLSTDYTQHPPEVLVGCSEQHLSAHYAPAKLHNDVVSPWQKLTEQAQEDGLALTIVSSYRSFEQQLAIWNNKFNGKLAVYDINEQPLDVARLSPLEKINAIMLFSALPGASRHHWGTDIDVYAPNLQPKDKKLQLQVWEYEVGGPQHELSLWLNEHAPKFGFYFPYDKYRGGISHEPWHLSYGPVASCYQQAMSPALIAQQLSQVEIAGKADILAHLPELFTQFINNVAEFTHG